MYATLGKIADTLLVVFYIYKVITLTCLDMLMYRHTFHDTPSQAFLRDESLPCLDFLDRPHLTVRDMMERMDDVRDTRLTYIVKAYRVIGAVPAPGLFHQIFHGLLFKDPSLRSR